MNIIKNKYFAILFFLMAPVLLFANHFPSPSSNFQPMNIYIIEITYNGVGLMAGDEVAVYDDAILVGSEVLSHTASSSNIVELIAYRENNGDAGFHEGNPMTFKAWDASSGIEHTFDGSEVSYFDPATGDPLPPALFQGLGSVMVALNATVVMPTHDLTISAAAGGTTSPAPGTHAYEAGSTASIEALPNTGWQFDYWEGSVVDPNSASTTVEMNSAKSVVAHFTCVQYTLSMSVNPAGTGSTTPAPGDTLACEGEEVTVIAMPATGYHFTSWTGPVADANSATTTVNMDANKSVSANFQADSPTDATLTMQVNQSGWGTTNPVVGQHNYPLNDVVTITATPAAGYQFVSWSGAVFNPNSATTTVTMDASKSVTANFSRTQVDLTMQVNQAGWGTTTPAVGTHNYNSGDVVSILATPSSGYEFVDWTGSVANPNSASTTITMDANKTAQANFARIEYQLTMGSATGGSSSPTAGSYTYYSGDVVPLDATPSAGYHFVNWSGAVVDPNSASTTVLMDAPKTVTPNFALDSTFPLTISVSPVAGGTTTPAPGTYNHPVGTNVTITASANAGYHFVNWTGDVQGTVTNMSMTVTMDRARLLSANFELDSQPQHTLTMQVNQSGWGTTDPAVGGYSYNQGSVVTITATAASGYRFVEWQGTVANANAEQTTVYIDGDKTVTAVFEAIPQHTLTMQTDPAGDVGGTANISTGNHLYNENTVVTLEAQPKTGYRFSYWQGDVADPNNATTTITMNADKTVILHFEPIPQYSIIIGPPADPSMGTTNPGPGTYVLYEGQTLTIQATPNPGYRFVNWNNDPSLTSPTITVTANSNKTYVPIFEIDDDVVLTVEVNGASRGNVVPSVGNHNYNYGDVINLEATPNNGYRFNYWTGDVVDMNSAVTTITMNGDKTVKANFDNVNYDLVMSKTPTVGGSILPAEGTHVYESWDVVAVEATPAPGYKFTGWTGDVANSQSANTTITMTGDKNLRANFAPLNEYTLTVGVSPSGSGSTSPSTGTHIYPPNQVVTVTATPAAGFVFKNWLGDVANPNSATTTIQITSDKNITAIFEEEAPDYYQLTMKATPTNAGTTSPTLGVHNFTPGVVVSVSATAKPGYYFSSWSGDVADPNNANTTVTMNSNKTVTANFQAGSQQRRLTLDVSPAGTGSTTPPVGAYTYNDGAVINLTATPANGYEFHYWSGGVSNSNDPTTTVSMTSDKDIVAHFRQKSIVYTLTISGTPLAGGNVIPSSGTHQYSQNAVVTIQALPAAGYEFSYWTGDVADPNSATTTVTMSGNKTVQAIFEQTVNQVILTMQVNPLEGGTTGPIPGSHSFTLNEVVHIIAVPNPGYVFSHWTGDVAVPNSASTSVTMTENKTVTAHFTVGQQQKAILTISSSPNTGGETIPSTGSYEYALNSVVGIQAMPAAGHIFVGWTGNVADPNSATTTVTMYGDQTVLANYELENSNNVIFSFNVSPVGTGTTAPSPGIHLYSKSQVVSVSAIPYDGYYFVGWHGDVTNPQSQTTTVVADTNKEVTAMFEKGMASQFTLSMLVNPQGGGITAPAEGSHDYDENEVVNIATVPSPGFVFKNWIGDVGDPNSPTTSVTMTGDKTIIANYTAVNPNQYMLTIAVNPQSGGVTVPNEGSHAYDAGQVVNLLAVANAGYRFTGWTGAVNNSNSSSTSINMTDNKMITANFVPEEYKVSVSVTPQGAGTTMPSIGDTLVAAGDFVTLKANANDGYKFAYWSGDITGANNPAMIQANKNVFVTAHFINEDEFISTPEIIAGSSALRQQVVDVFVRNAASNLGHNLEYQFDWGDGTLLAWNTLTSQKSDNVTVITTPVGGSGLPSNGQLIDYLSGQETSASLRVNGGIYRGAADAWAGEEPYEDTDAWDVFGPILNARGSIGYVNTPTDVLSLDFRGLSPSKFYSLVFFSNRNKHGWSRASIVSLKGADSFVNNSSTGEDEIGDPITGDVFSPNTKLPSDNTHTGYVARFDNVLAGSDGALTLNVKFGGGQGYEFKGKYGSAVMLQEIDPGTGTSTFTAFNDLAWDGNFYPHNYIASGNYLVRVRARCQNHPSIVSEWSAAKSIAITGCVVNTFVANGANAVVNREPDKTDYNYGEQVRLVAQGGPNWVFSHWNDNRSDSLAVKLVMVNDNKSFRANFKLVSDVKNEKEQLPDQFSIWQNYPNPFNPTTEIHYELPQPEHVAIQVYDIRGRLVKTLVDLNQPAGRHKVIWDATDNLSKKAPSGIYFYRMQAGEKLFTKRMVLLK
jgi:uncharacterized repeat protein (TIGR02543 family)